MSIFQNTPFLPFPLAFCRLSLWGWALRLCSSYGGKKPCEFIEEERNTCQHNMPAEGVLTNGRNHAFRGPVVVRPATKFQFFSIAQDRCLTLVYACFLSELLSKRLIGGVVDLHGVEQLLYGGLRWNFEKSDQRKRLSLCSHWWQLPLARIVEEQLPDSPNICLPTCFEKPFQCT